ncbi:MAG: 3-hydroxyacyl-CoA dehydrogenase NAD-binding domain-containing protein [Ferruginibacter sp.]
MIENICVAGAGTMGSGIALSAAQNGFPVILFDTNEQVLNNARNSIATNLEVLLFRKVRSVQQISKVSSKGFILPRRSDNCKATLVIEAIIEKEDAKVSLFNQLASINDAQTIFASNTSSLSVSAIQEKISHPERVAGLHFFNPAQLMKLVEVVKAAQTSDEVINQLVNFSHQLKKTPVVCIDAPGFIVNRVARHYYLEAMKLVESGIAGFETVDEVMEASGFKMGPFKLMDLIGMDINLAVSTSLYNAFGETKRFKPSPLQIQKVAEGNLGRKTGKGFYAYNAK